MTMAIFILERTGSTPEWFARQILGRSWILVVFGLVLAYFISLVIRIAREIRACRQWIDKAIPSSHSRVVSQLQLFLRHSEEWRGSDILLPLSDYSDRIDSIIEGLADRLHNSVNLFLIVGLAGTFLGMAEFAREAPALQMSNDPKAVLDALRSALGISFPIGFLGLLLTVIGHPISNYWEARLQNAARHAVNATLAKRAPLRARVESTLIDAIRALPQAITSALEANQSVLREQLRPLSDIPAAIRDSNQEMVAPLKQLYTESRKEWKDVSQRLEDHTKRIAESIGKLETPVQMLTAKIGDLGAFLTSTQTVIDHMLSETGKVSDSVLHVKVGLDQTAKSLRDAGTELQNLPKLILENLQGVRAGAIEAIRLYFENLGRDYVDFVRNIAVASSGDIAEATKSASSKISEAAVGLLVAAEVMAPQLKQAIQDGAEHLKQHLQDFTAAFNEKFPAALLELKNTLGSAAEQIESTRSLLQGLTSAGASADKHVSGWKAVEDSLHSTEAALQANCNYLERMTISIQAAADVYSASSRHLAGGGGSNRSRSRPRTRWWRRFWPGASNGA
jgi:hypothetical protein